MRTTIGGVRTWSIAAAQAEARRLKALVDRGIDPRLEAVEQRAKADESRIQAVKRSLTVADVWPVYLQARRSKWGELHYRDHVRLANPGNTEKKRGSGLTVAGPIAALMPLALGELTASNIAKWVETEAACRPTKAAHAYRLIRAFVRWCSDEPDYQGVLPTDVFGTQIVRESVPRANAKEGDSLQREQLAA